LQKDIISDCFLKGKNYFYLICGSTFVKSLLINRIF
jgi:hypothetical protein